MTKTVSILLVGLTALVGTETWIRNFDRMPAAVVEIATDSLRDVAVAGYSPRHPVIYYNPILMQRLGPLLSSFFMAHEYGHIVYHHTRAYALSAGRQGRDSVIQLRELEADCYAAQTLANDSRPAVEAAVRFFSRMGPFRYDAEHPTGAERAARILSCLPPTEEALPGAAHREPPPARTGLPLPITIAATPQSPGSRWREIHFRIGRAEGNISSIRPPASSVVRHLAPGTYEYEVTVELYTLDDLLQLNPSGTARGRGRITVRSGDTIGVDIAADGKALLRVEAD